MVGISVSLSASILPIPPALRHRLTGGNEQAPPPVDVLIFKPLLFAEMGVQRRRYVCRAYPSAAARNAVAN